MALRARSLIALSKWLGNRAFDKAVLSQFQHAANCGAYWYTQPPVLKNFQVHSGPAHRLCFPQASACASESEGVVNSRRGAYSKHRGARNDCRAVDASRRHPA